MLEVGVTVTIGNKQYKVVRGVSGCNPCALCGFTHLEGCVFPCSACNAPKVEERLIPDGCYLQFCGKSYKPGQLVTIGKHTYRIRKAPKGAYVCGACRKANGGIICNTSDYKPYSCAKYTHYNCYLQLIK